MPRPEPSVASAIHARRRAGRLSLRRLGKLSRICYTKLHYFEHGLIPRPDEAERLAAALDCTPADLGQRVQESSSTRVGGAR